MRKRLLTLFACFVCLALYSSGQSKEIQVDGKISDPNGIPVIGATIMVKGTPNGTTTAINGAFSIKAPSDGTLIVSHLGYVSSEIAIGNRTRIEFILREATEQIDDVVVIGYGTIRKVDLTGAVNVVDPDKAVGSRPVTDLARGLQGMSPGLNIITSSGNIGIEPQIYIRTLQGSVNADAKPLILLDNVEVPSMMAINPNDIETVTILSDASSTAIYGTRAAWGVILLTSKKGKKGAKGATVSYSNNFSWASPVNMPKIADGADAVEYLLKSERRTTPGKANFNILGAYYDDLSIDRMRQWKQNYGHLNLSDEMVEGRDFERRNGNIYYYRPWDIEDIFLNDAAPYQKHNLSVSGRDEKTNYFGSIGYQDQQGLVKITPKPDSYRQLTARANIESQVTKWFRPSISLMLTNEDKEYPNFRLANAESGSNEYWYNIFRYPETYPYGTVNGIPLKNIRTELEQAHMNSINKFFGQLQLGAVITPVEGLDINLDYSYSMRNNHTLVAATPIGGINNWQATTDLKNYEESFFVDQDYVINNSAWYNRQTGHAFATYSKKICDHDFKIMGGMDIDYSLAQGHGSKVTKLLFPSQPEISLAVGEQTTPGTIHTHWSTLGFFGRVNYTYANKYILQMSGRYDGASNFPPKYLWGFFPSISAGWVVTEEKFMSSTVNSGILSFLKLSAAWGASGNNQLRNIQYRSVLTPGNSNWYIGADNQRSFSSPTTPSDMLTWETIKTVDLIANAKFFKNALDVTIDVFQRTTSDMVTSGEQMPDSYGTRPPLRNFGELVAKGWELSATYSKGFRNGGFSVRATLADQTGKITKFFREYGAVKVGGTVENYVGANIGDIWGYETDRLFQYYDFDGNDGLPNPTWYYAHGVPNQDPLNTAANFHYGPGDVKYKDINGDGVVNFGAGTSDDSGDMKVIGNELPRYSYGITLSGTFKGIDASVFIQGVGKRSHWASGAVFIPNFVNLEAMYANHMDYWTPERTNAFYPAPSNPGANNHNGNWQPQTRFLLNMAYTRLKNVQIGYTLPAIWTNKVKLSKVRVYFSAENLLTFDHLNGVTIDPEIRLNSVEDFNDARSYGKTYPYSRTLSFGMQINL